MYPYVLCFNTGAEYKAPQTAFLCAGEKALIEMDLDLLKSSLDEIKAWDDNIVDVGTYPVTSIAFS